MTLKRLGTTALHGLTLAFLYLFVAELEHVFHFWRCYLAALYHWP